MSSISFATIPNKLKTTDVDQHEWTAEQFFDHLNLCPVGLKEEQALILVRFNPCPTPCRNHGGGKRARKCRPGQFHKLGDNVAAVTGIGIDLDEMEPEHEAALLKWAESSGLELFLWQTYKHTPENPRWRVVAFFSKEVVCSPAQWREDIYPALWTSLGLKAVGAAYDKNTMDIARNFYAPRKPSVESPRGGHF